jgi:hypothetical protein
MRYNVIVNTFIFILTIILFYFILFYFIYIFFFFWKIRHLLNYYYIQLKLHQKISCHPNIIQFYGITKMKNGK